MSIKEIVNRINFLTEHRQKSKKIELKAFMSLLHLTVSAGSSPSRKNNQSFYRHLNKIFNDKKEEEESYEEVMNLVNKENVKE